MLKGGTELRGRRWRKGATETAASCVAASPATLSSAHPEVRRMMARSAEADMTRIAPMSYADLDERVLEWAADEGWNPGLDDAEAFLAADPGGFLMGWVGEEPVAAISAVRHGPSFGFLGLYLCRPEWRGRGHGRRSGEAGLAHLGDRTVGLDGVVAQQSELRPRRLRPLAPHHPAPRRARAGGVAAHRSLPAGASPRPSAARRARERRRADRLPAGLVRGGPGPADAGARGGRRGRRLRHDPRLPRAAPRSGRCTPPTRPTPSSC